MNGWRTAADFLALRRNTGLLLVAVVLAGTGERLWLGFAPKYIEFLAQGILTASQIAFLIGNFDALQTLVGALYNYSGGWLADHYGQRRTLFLSSFISIAGYVLVLLWSHWLALLFGSFLFLAWSALSLPATFSVVATSLQRHRHTMGVGVQSMVRRVPMMVGPLIGGWLITHYGWAQGVRFALLGCIALSVTTMIFQWFMVEPAAKDPVKTGVSFLTIVRSFNPTLRELLVSDILIRFCERLPYAWVIFWAMNHGGVSAEQFGWLVAIEMVTAMLCYIPVAHLADKHGQRPFVLATFVFFTLFPLTLLFAHNFAWLAVAFAVRGLKEFGEPARKALIIAQAPPELRARTYGAYYLIRDCVVTTGSFLGAWLWSLSPQANFIGAAVCGGLGTIWFWRLVARRPG